MTIQQTLGRWVTMFFAFGCGTAQATAADSEPVRVAIVGETDAATVDLATVHLSEDRGIELLEREQIETVLNEQKLASSGLVDADQAIQLGTLLRVDLCGVLETEPTDKRLLGIVVFDAATGIRLWDESLIGETPDRQATHVADAVRKAVEKFRAEPKSIRPVGLLSIRNAELPRSADVAVQATGRLLERRLIHDSKVVVLERSRLEHVVRERTLPTAKPLPPLLASLVLIDLEVGRGTKPQTWQATARMSDFSGQVISTVSATSPAGEVDQLAIAIQNALAKPLNASPRADLANRVQEADRFAREAFLLWRHGEFARSAQSAEAAYALNPSETRHLRMLIYRLMDAAIELVDPGRQNHGGPPREPIEPEKLEQSLGLAEHALDLQHEHFHRITQQPDWESRTYELTAINFPIYLSKIVAPRQPLLENVQELVAEFVTDHREYELQTVGRTLHAVATSPKSYRVYTSWVARPALRDLVRYSRMSHAGWAEDVATVLLQWAKRCDDWRDSPDSQLLASSSFVLNELRHLIRIPDMAKVDYQTLANAFDELQSFRHPLLRHSGRLLRLTLDRSTGNIKPDALAKGVQQLSSDLLTLAVAENESPSAQARDVWIALAIDTHALLPFDERTPLNRRLFDGLRRERYYSGRLFSMTAMGYSDDDQRRDALQFVDETLDLLKSEPKGLPETQRRQIVADLESRQRKLHELLGKTSGHVTPWKSVRTLIDVADAEVGIRAVAAPVVYDRSVYTIGMSWDTETGCVRLALLKLSLEANEFQTLGEYTLSDLPVPRPYRSPTGDEFTLYSVIERSTSQGSDFIRDAAIANGHYYAATMGHGILSFPLDGQSPRRVDEHTTLPSNHIQALCVCEDSMYAWAGSPKSAAYLVRVPLGGGEATIIASSRRAISRTPLDNTSPVQCDLMVADPERNRVVFRLTNSGSDDKLGIWEFRPDDSGLRQLWQTRHFLTTSLARTTGEPFVLIREDADLYRFDFTTDQSQRVIHRDTERPWTFHPIALVDQALWVGIPFGRVQLNTGKHEPFPPLRKGTFQPGCFCRRLDDDTLLLGDPSAIWLIELMSSKPATSEKSTDE